jgi:glutamate-1-semialdehyde 2,1-aminomutase
MSSNNLKRNYKKSTKHSHLLYKKSLSFFPGGISHNIRFFSPYPFFVKKAAGKYLVDVDGNTYTDYWMGHWALILGHSPKNVSLALSKQVKNGTLYGTVNTISIELAEIIQKLMPKAEKMRFATTGSEATMYAVRLARAVTRKKIVAKIIGGWHGFNSSLLESVNYPFEINEGLGLDVDNKYIQSIPFNDLDTSLQLLNNIKEDLACIIVEPILGGAGCITPNNDYLQGLQEFSKKNNIIFILDEIVTGFRLSIHGAYKMFKLDPDLFTLGKIAGGGLPIGIVCGKNEILSISNPNDKNNNKNLICSIGGGTFSSNPVTMTAGLKTLEFLQNNKKIVYSKINELGAYTRKELQRIFNENNIDVKITGIGSLFNVHFLNDYVREINNANDVALADKEKLRKYHFALISNYKIFFLPFKMGAISYQHSKVDIDKLLNSTRSIIESKII